MAKILRIDMTGLKTKWENPSPDLSEVGGRALSSRIIYKEVPPTCHPLRKTNKLIFAPGLLAGSAAPNSGRLSVGAKSPLTGGTKEANVGGTAAQKLGRLGIKAIIVEGATSNNDNLYIIKLDKKGAAILHSPELKGMGTYETASMLRKVHGENVGILCIGPAGELRLAAASVASTDPEGRPSRHAARGGLGAVMGAKGVKAIVIDDADTKILQARERSAFREVHQAFAEEILERKATGLLSKFGTVGGLSWISKFGSLPTRNFTSGSFEGSAHIGGKEVAEINATRGGSFGHICMPGCVVRCSNVMYDKEGNYLTSGFEYESSAMLGANLGIDDLDTVMAMEKICDDFGLDTIEVGVALGVACDAKIFSFGDGDRAMDLLRDIGMGTVLGKVLGQGGEITARVFGIDRVPSVKGQGVPAHDPRKEIGTGIAYASSPQGADHTGVVIFDVEGTAEMLVKSRALQIRAAATDSVGICQMAEPSMDVMAKLVSSFYGWNWREEDIFNLGRTALEEEVAFNRSAGLGLPTDKLPDFFSEEPLPPFEGVFQVAKSELEKVLAFSQ